MSDIYLDIFKNIEEINLEDKKNKTREDIFNEKENGGKPWLIIYSKIMSKPKNKFNINNLSYLLFKLRANLKLEELK
jgi:hypothetical protein